MTHLLSAEDLGRRIVLLRDSRDMNQRELAERLGKSQTEVSRWENGKVLPNYDTVVKIAEALRVDVSEFMEQNGHATATPIPSEVWEQSFMEVLLREARAAEKRAEAAQSWARWLEKEADARESVRSMLQQQTRPGWDQFPGEKVQRAVDETRAGAARDAKRRRRGGGESD